MVIASTTLIYHRNVPLSPHSEYPANPWSWIRDTIRNRGVLGAIGYYAAGTLALMRDLLPARRRSRYGDVDYDFEHAVDTTWATVPLRTRVRELLSGGQYQPSEPSLFHEILQALPSAVEGLTFIDLGSGKGRTLLLASDYPFRRIIGIELLAELSDIAVENVARYHSEKQRCLNIESYPLDARNFHFPPEATVLYLFNPFPEHVLRTVLENLHRSLMGAPRIVYVLYHNLVHEQVFREQPWLKELRRTHQYTVYEATIP